MKSYDFKMFQTVISRFPEKCYLNDKYLNSLAHETIKQKINHSRIGDIVTIINIVNEKRFKRTNCSWREVDQNGKFLN